MSYKKDPTPLFKELLFITGLFLMAAPLFLHSNIAFVLMFIGMFMLIYYWFSKL
jgi:hypothetical protein